MNPAIYSGMQREWDKLSGRAKINLVVTGGVTTLMNKIFKEKTEPLYGCDADRMTVRLFEVSVLKEILAFYHPGYAADNLLALWTFTGGVAKYVSLLTKRKACTRRKTIDVLIEEDSYCWDEGWAVSVEEFGKEYGTYFSILPKSECHLWRMCGREHNFCLHKQRIGN